MNIILHTVVLYRFSTSNHNFFFDNEIILRLYYIVSLHQTTTPIELTRPLSGCIISFLYIKPQHWPCCIWFIKSCIISFLYIKPQPVAQMGQKPFSCIISFLYIKPQLQNVPIWQRLVVLYRFSTSNHNGITPTPSVH